MSPLSSVHWFRKGLRIHDNPSLMAALEKRDSEYYQLRPVYILDSHIIKNRKIGKNRWRFLQQSLEDLDKNLRQIGSRLYFLQGDPESVFNDIFQQWNVKRLTFEADIEPYSKERDTAVTKLAEKFGIDVISKVSHTLYDPEMIISKNSGKTPLKLNKWIDLAHTVPPPSEPLPPPASIPDEARAPIDEGQYMIPTLQELGVDIDDIGPCLYPGGETEALRRMEEHIARKEYICNFEKPKTSPNSLEPSTTVLSPYLSLGCLSPGLFYSKLIKVVKGQKHTKPPVSLIGQMYWREFYYTAGAATPNFDQMKDNSICVQVPWDSEPGYLDAWAHGRTGYPFIDAIMRQLRQEGWIHHLARHAVACFLTRGDLWQSWEDGQKVFEELLLDADWALNAGNWLWLSASAFYSQYYRVYGPVSFGKKTDKSGDYIRKYVPELKNFPAEHIYEPWTAPFADQKQAGCVIGTDYPNRIVIHEGVLKNNLKSMSAAYRRHRIGKSVTEERKTESSSDEASGSGSPNKKQKKQKKMDNYLM